MNVTLTVKLSLLCFQNFKKHGVSMSFLKFAAHLSLLVKSLSRFVYAAASSLPPIFGWSAYHLVVRNNFKNSCKIYYFICNIGLRKLICFTQSFTGDETDGCCKSSENQVTNFEGSAQWYYIIWLLARMIKTFMWEFIFFSVIKMSVELSNTKTSTFCWLLYLQIWQLCNFLCRFLLSWPAPVLWSSIE